MDHAVPVTQARAEFAELINRAAYGGERIAVTRHGKPIAALVSAADLARLEEWDQARDTPPEPPRILRLGGGPSIVGPQSSAGFDSHDLGLAARHQPPGDATA